jgi:hypothetical protein
MIAVQPFEIKAANSIAWFSLTATRKIIGERRRCNFFNG